MSKILNEAKDELLQEHKEHQRNTLKTYLESGRSLENELHRINTSLNEVLVKISTLSKLSTEDYLKSDYYDPFIEEKIL